MIQVRKVCIIKMVLLGLLLMEIKVVDVPSFIIFQLNCFPIMDQVDFFESLLHFETQISLVFMFGNTPFYQIKLIWPSILMIYLVPNIKKYENIIQAPHYPIHIQLVSRLLNIFATKQPKSNKILILTMVRFIKLPRICQSKINISLMNATDFICGLFAGWSQVIVGQPFDFIKVRIQTATQDIPILNIAKEIRQQFGIRGFYRGSSSLFFGFAFTIGSQFLVFEWAKKTVFKRWGERSNMEYCLSKLKVWQVAVTGAFAGCSVSAIYCPVEYVKIRKQLGVGVDKSSLGILFKQIRQNGIKNIFKGFWSTVARQTIGSFFYFGSYETLIRSMARQGRQKATTLDFILAGGLAGMAFHLITYPIDTIKTNIQAGQSLKRAVRAAFELSKLKGYNIVLTRAAIINASSFLVYEKSQQYFSRWNSYLYSVY